MLTSLWVARGEGCCNKTLGELKVLEGLPPTSAKGCCNKTLGELKAEALQKEK